VRFAKFATVGGTGVLVNLALLYLLVDVSGWNVLLAAALSIEVSTLSNFLLNRAWTWRDRDRSWWSLLRYHVVTAVGAGVQWLVLLAGTLLGFHYAVSSLAGVAAATAWNFLGNHRLAFVEYTPERRRRDLRILLYGLSLALHLVLAALLAHDWDTFVFQKTVEEFLHNGVTPYDTGHAKPDYVYFGVGLPLQPMWYAYPPLPLLLMTISYAPVVAGTVTAPWAARLLIKAPFLASNFLLAALAHRLVRTGPGDPEARAKKALRVEAFLLFNPLFVFVATIWGMFESLLLSFLVLSLLEMRRGSWGRAGAWWGAATLVKIFPLYLAPLLLVHVWRRSGTWRAPFRYFLMGGLVFGLVSLPFWALQPSGFIEQVFRMHASRPPGRFSPIAVLYEGALSISRQWPGTLPDDAGLVKVFSLLSFSLTLAVLVLLVVASLRHRATERALLFWGGLSLMGGLLATKVVSEQYILLPLGLLALAHWHPEALDLPAPPRRMRRFLLHTTTFVCIAAMLDNVHFLLFLPDDVAHRVLGRSVPDTILQLANFFHLTSNQLRALLGITGAIGLVVPLWISVRLLAPALADAFARMGRAVHDWTRRLPVRATGARVYVAAAFFLLMTPAVAVGLLAPKRDTPPEDSGVLEGPLVLVHYRTDWFNPTKRPEVPGGRWAQTTLTPTSGYYNAVAHKIAEDVALLRQGGADALLFTFDPAYEGQAAAGRLVAEEAGVPYALEVDLAHLALANGGVALTPETADRARELFNGPAFDFWRGGYHLRLAPDAGFLVFLAGAERVHPTFTEAERHHVADLYADAMGPAATRALETSASTSLWRLAPTSEAELEAPDAIQWRRAYMDAERDWWTRALQLEGNGTRFDLVVDTDLPLPLPEHGHARVVGHYDPVGAKPREITDPGLQFATVPADPLMPEAYATAWSAAVRDRPHALIVPWNDFDLGQAIEPTLQEGARLLRLTERWAPAYRGVGLDPELPAPAWSPTPQASA
jgi:putative flippase GtrA